MSDAGFFWTRSAYAVHLLILWNKMKNKQLTATEWMLEYDEVFRLCVAEKEDFVYRACKKLFETVDKSDMTKEDYITLANEFLRIFAYLDRMWILVNRQIPLIDVAINAWPE